MSNHPDDPSCIHDDPTKFLGRFKKLLQFVSHYCQDSDGRLVHPAESRTDLAPSLAHGVDKVTH